MKAGDEVAVTSGGRAGIRAYTALASGVHATPVEKVVEQVRTSAPVENGEQEPRPPVWIDVTRPGEAEAAFLRDTLGFHPLAVEDSIRGHQRPKLERYPDYFFLVIYAVALDGERGRIGLKEIHVFLGQQFVVTVHDREMRQISEILARWRAAPSFFKDVGSLAHALIDTIVDEYFPVLDHFEQQAERIEASLFRDTEETIMQQILFVRRELALFRRVVAPQRDMLSTLLRRDLPFLRPELFPYFQDVHDHTIRAVEEIDTIRELLAASLDARFSLASNQLNQTMRVMVAWSIILMSMTLIAGIYGMNFTFMPELTWRWGYFGAIGLMLALGIALTLFFRRRRWL